MDDAFQEYMASRDALDQLAGETAAAKANVNRAKEELFLALYSTPSKECSLVYNDVIYDVKAERKTVVKGSKTIDGLCKVCKEFNIAGKALTAVLQYWKKGHDVRKVEDEVLVNRVDIEE